MLARMKRMLAAALASAAFPVLAADEPPEVDAPNPMAVAIARIKALPEAELKAFYRRCARASVRGHLSNGEIALCSVGYQHLLDRHFGGDFHAFLEWRRGADARPPSPAADPS